MALFVIALSASAQENEGTVRKSLFGKGARTEVINKDYSAYLTGAIPEENGMVCFTQTFSSSLSASNMMDALQKWAKKYFVPQPATSTQLATEPGIVSINREENKLTLRGDEYLVFKKNAMVLNQTRIHYILSLQCRDKSCEAMITKIVFDYNDTESEDSYSRIPAEEMIVDKYALRKNGTKLVRGYGTDFRVRTVDLKDQLFKEIQEAVR